MTFIATVVAQKGVAVIADSLATLMEDIIETDDIYEYITNLPDGEQVNPQALYRLSKRKPNYTKNYAEKLFRYDKFTAITIAGNASINRKTIEALINEHKQQKQVVDDSSFDFDDIIASFVEFLKIEVGEHFKERNYIDLTIFYVTHYNPNHIVTKISKISIGSADLDDFNEHPELVVRVTPIPEHRKVICDGQNATTDRILYGDLSSLFKVASQIIRLVYKDRGEDVPNNYIENFFNEHNVLEEEDLRESMKILKLNSLSLQQAVNLAALLMRIERDLQSFTENIPTVGGVIKMAVIDRDGFRMIMGDSIETPNI